MKTIYGSRCVRKFKKTVLWSMTLLIVAFSFLPLIKVEAAEKKKQNTIRVGWYESEHFQEGTGDDAEKSGYSFDYLQRISDYTGWNYEYVYGQWSDIYDMFLLGDIDVLAGISFAEERKTQMLFPSYQMGTDFYYLYQHTGDKKLDITNPADFDGKKFGAVKNNRMTIFLEEWLRANEFNAEVIQYEGFEARDIAYDNGEIDGIAATDQSIKSDSGFVPVAKLGEEPYYLAVANNRKDILDELNTVLGTLALVNPNYLDVMQIKSYGELLANGVLTGEEEQWLSGRSELKVGYVDNYMPFCDKDENGDARGLVVDVMNHIVTALNLSDRVSLEFVAYNSFKEMGEGLVAKEVDLTFPTLDERRYLSSMKITGTFSFMTVPFYVAYLGNYSDDIFSKIATSSRPLQEITSNYPDSILLTYDNGEDCVEAIMSGEATCTIMSSYRLKYILGDSKYRNINVLPYSSSISYCLGVNKDSYELISILNKGVSFCNEAEIVDLAYRYIQNDIKTTFVDYVTDNLMGFFLLLISVIAVIAISFSLYLAELKKGRRLLIDNLENANILAALSANYEAVLIADLDAETISTVRASKKLEDMHYKAATFPYTKAITDVINQVVLPDEREAFLKFIDINAMRERIKKEDSFSYRYAICDDGSGRYIYEMTFVHVKSVKKGKLVIFGTKCIDNILKMEREEGQYNAALLNECAFFYEFDVTEGTVDGHFISKSGYDPSAIKGITYPVSYDEFNKLAAKELGFYAITEEEGKLWTVDGLKEAYALGKRSVLLRSATDKLKKYMDATIILTEDEHNHHLHAVYICKDVTDFVEGEQAQKKALTKALKEAEAANAAKTTFLSNMSHDIRTPMNAILGFSALIEKNNEDPKRVSEYNSKIQNASRYLLEIINNVLDMARIESGKVGIDESAIDVKQMCLDVLSVFDAQIREKNLTIVPEAKYSHRYIVIDHTKVKQIAINLLSNAVKYTPDGGTIYSTLEEFESDKEGYGVFRYTISDTGIGMSKEFCEHVFDAFEREYNTTESKIVGTGLGMSIVKKLVELMGGTISVDSELGKGTTFVVELEAKIADDPDVYIEKQVIDAEAVDFDAFKGKRILLAEDNDLNAEIAVSILEENGFMVERATDGANCVDMLLKSAAGYYDMILMDVQMPKLNGYDAAKSIRALDDEGKKDIPIIAVTANAFEEDRVKALDAGMNAHLAKPINVSELMKIVASIL